jgi:sodium/hydrogen antiporter
MEYALLLAAFGALVLAAAWLPLMLEKLPLSLPMICIVVGFLSVWVPYFPEIEANPLADRYLTERLTEFAVIVALMGAGLKLDRPISWRGWQASWRLVGIAMPLTIMGIALLGWSLLGLSMASALLLGAALAPTDPVLASDVQVGPPQSEEEDDVRFALTSEAGLNDGAAFPFVFLAIAIAHNSVSGEPFLQHWFAIDVLWKIAIGLSVGWLGGKIMGYLAFRLPKKTGLSETKDGFVALGVTCLAYGTTELAHGYGFLAVFVSAVALRSVERRHSYHRSLHDFSDQIERLLMVVVLVCFGMAIADGAVFGAFTWPVAATSAIVIFVIRPLAGYLCLCGYAVPREEKAVIAFFGIRGLGSFYYLAFALGQAEFAEPQMLWVTVCTVVLASIIIHGISVTPIMQRLDAQGRL